MMIWNVIFGVLGKSIEIILPSNRPHLPAAIESWHEKVRHLPPLILKSPVGEDALEVCLAVNVHILLAKDAL